LGASFIRLFGDDVLPVSGTVNTMFIYTMLVLFLQEAQHSRLSITA
jgi:hypothetical protein